MWRSKSTHLRGETEFLDQMIVRIQTDKKLFKHAEAHLKGAANAEPLIAESLRTPQDVRYHAEGPFLGDHLHLMLMCLYALIDEKMHLSDIEEFRQMKGHEGEIEELEETIKENVSIFEVYALCHDIGKWTSVRFDSKKGSRGEKHGFVKSHKQHAHDQVSKDRDSYLKLFEQFEQQHPNDSAQELQANFFLTYNIEVHYPGHARIIHTPVYSQLFDRLCEAHQLTDRSRAILEDLITHHMGMIKDFQVADAKKMERYFHIANKRGFDSDDFIDLAQGILFLDAVCGSRHLGPHGYWHDASLLGNFLKSEHDFDPSRRTQKESKWELAKQQAQNRLFREVGLDGSAIMKLLGMNPGPKFGKLLQQIQGAILGKSKMPALDKGASKEIEDRAGRFYKKSFVKGE